MCLKPMDDVRTDFARFHDVKFDHIQEQLGVLKLGEIGKHRNSIGLVVWNIFYFPIYWE